jgi:thioredoxin-related protein
MLTCKQVSHALAKEDYQKMRPMRRFFLSWHVKLCIFCGKFNRQIMESQDMCRCYKQHEEAIATQRPKMDAAKKEQLKALLAAQSKQNRN